jgi:hypothetical protein
LEQFIILSIKELYENKKCYLKYDLLIKDICYKLTAPCIKILDIHNVIMKYFIDNKINKLNELIRLSSECEYNLLQSNKIFFSIEYYFDSIVRLF